MDLIICEAQIQKHLTTQRLGRTMQVYETIDSTNLAAKQMASSGCPDGTCLIALSQTQGRGRLGRSFYSPAGSGIYMSVVLRPDLWQTDPTLVTVGCAVAVSEALDTVCGIHTQIKWVNDIYCNAKKLCGILVESGFVNAGPTPDYMVIGMGINLKTPENLPDELSSIVTSAEACGSVSFDANRLAAEVLNCLGGVLDTPPADFLERYRSRSCVLGRDIHILKPDGTKTPAKALEIDNHGALIAQLASGERVHLNSGEISVRVI